MTTRARIAALTALALLPACISPPAVMAGGHDGFDRALLPPATEIIEVPVHGETLRGIYVPAPDRAGGPLVLHVLEARSSATAGCQPEVSALGVCGYPVLWELRDLGYASLMLDYRGVGASSGERDVQNLVADTTAMWQAALDRVGGDEERIVLRTTSLGTVGGSALVHAGVRPALWTVIAPIDPRTVAFNVIDDVLWTPLARFVDLFVGEVADIDVFGALANAPCPLLCFLPQNADYFVSEAENARFRRAVRAGDGRLYVLNANHIECAGAGHWLRPVERRVLRRTFGQLAPARARRAAIDATGELPDATTPEIARVNARLDLLLTNVDCRPDLALAAVTSDIAPGAMLPWVAWLERRAAANRTVIDSARRATPAPGPGPAPTDWHALFDLRDPSGPLQSLAIERLTPWLVGHAIEHGHLDRDALLRAIGTRRYDDVRTAFYAGKDVEIPLGGDMMWALLSAGYSPRLALGERPQRAARTLHKALGDVGPVPEVEATWSDLEATEDYEVTVQRITSYASAPPMLDGQPVDLLFRVFVTELDAEAPELAAFVRRNRAVFRAMLRLNEHYCDTPVLVAAAVAAAAADSGSVADPSIPRRWIELHRDTIRAMPINVQRHLARRWLAAPWRKVLKNGRSPRIRMIYDALGEFDNPDAIGPDQRFDRIDLLTLAGIPASRDPADHSIRIWVRGEWQDY